MTLDQEMLETIRAASDAAIASHVGSKDTFMALFGRLYATESPKKLIEFLCNEATDAIQDAENYSRRSAELTNAMSVFAGQLIGAAMVLCMGRAVLDGRLNAGGQKMAVELASRSAAVAKAVVASMTNIEA